jgi:hypothetical protein
MPPKKEPITRNYEFEHNAAQLLADQLHLYPWFLGVDVYDDEPGLVVYTRMGQNGKGPCYGSVEPPKTFQGLQVLHQTLYTYQRGLSDYLDMPVREVLDAMIGMRCGRLAFNGPGPKGEKREPYCCAFATGMEDAKKLSMKMLRTTQGLPLGAPHVRYEAALAPVPEKPKPYKPSPIIKQAAEDFMKYGPKK